LTDAITSGAGTEENPLVHPITGERLVFRRRARDTNAEFLEVLLNMAPGGFVSAAHVHPVQEERFEIGGAAAMFRVNGVQRLYQPGDIAVIPPGTPHTWWNPSQEPVTAVIRFTPALDTETMFETFFGLAADGKVSSKGLPSILQAAVLLRAFHDELRLPPPVGWVVGAGAIVLAPIARRMGYQARYDRYSGPVASEPTAL
jgi:quercetin dioxygenase-like cupin family protein